MENFDETWRPVRGYAGLYEVSDKGRVKSLPKKIKDPNGRIRNYGERILKQMKVNKYGHLKVGLYKDEKQKEFLVHRLVLMAFDRMPKENEECLHFDGDPSNNSLSNLRWGTSKENTEDSIRHGTLVSVDRSWSCKLTQDDVLKIRCDERTSSEIANDYPVCPRTIRAIKSKNYWRHI